MVGRDRGTERGRGEGGEREEGGRAGGREGRGKERKEGKGGEGGWEVKGGWEGMDGRRESGWAELPRARLRLPSGGNDGRGYGGRVGGAASPPLIPRG